MTNDADWVADVRRWYFSTQAPRPAPVTDADTVDLGYEAAHPSLQSPHWPDAPRGGERDNLS